MTGRPSVGPAFSLRFPTELLLRVDRAAKAENLSRAEYVRRVVEKALEAVQENEPCNCMEAGRMAYRSARLYAIDEDSYYFRCNHCSREWSTPKK